MIAYLVCTDVDRDQLYVELRWKDVTWAEVYFDPRRESYVTQFYELAGEGAVDLREAQQALLVARRMLVEHGQPELP